MPWRIVVDSDAQEVYRYPTIFSEEHTDQYPLDTFTHLLVENLASPDSVKPAKSEDGSMTLVPNPDWYWTALRTQRNQLLKDSDWTALSDAHLSQDKKDAWFTYRQALRDLPDELANTVPEGAGPPDLFEWPLDPTVVVQAPVSGSRVGNLMGQV